jgi:hypothetical protein
MIDRVDGIRWYLDTPYVDFDLSSPKRIGLKSSLFAFNTQRRGDGDSF